jgi:hypothetical protein
LATGNSPYAITVDATSVYWTDTQNSTVMKVALGGGTPVTIASGQAEPFSIAVDATSVYFFCNGPGAGSALKRVALGGGAPVTLDTPEAPSFIAVDPTSVYYTNQIGSVVKVATGGGATVTLAYDYAIPAGPWGIAIDATSVYWTDLVQGTVMSTAK